jgi:hypothetical protein
MVRVGRNDLDCTLLLVAFSRLRAYAGYDFCKDGQSCNQLSRECCRAPLRQASVPTRKRRSAPKGCAIRWLAGREPAVRENFTEFRDQRACFPDSGFRCGDERLELRFLASRGRSPISRQRSVLVAIIFSIHHLESPRWLLRQTSTPGKETWLHSWVGAGRDFETF